MHRVGVGERDARDARDEPLEAGDDLLVRLAIDRVPVGDEVVVAHLA